VFIEDAGKHQPYKLDAGLIVPSQSERRERRVNRVSKSGVIRLPYRTLRDLRMHKQRSS
jgi:hypothetical protein